MNFHFLVNALPEVESATLDDLADIRTIIETNLTAEAREAFHYLLYRNDNKNLLKLLRKRDGVLPRTAVHFYEPAVFSFEDLEDILIDAYEGEYAPPAYMRQFLDEEKHAGFTVRERENRLVDLYYEEGTRHPQEYIREMFLFKRDLKNILLALNARAQGFKITRITVGEYDLPAELATATQTDFGLSGQYAYIPELVALLNAGDLVHLEKRLDELLIEHLRMVVAGRIFSLNYVLHYFLKLSLFHRWLLLSPQKGERALEEIIEDIVTTAERAAMTAGAA
ncbi:MAG: DUF2764 family protein [Turneriella sp.]